MKKLLLILVAFGALLSIPASAQNYNFNIGGLQYASGASAPGSCSRAGSFFFKNTATTVWYICNGATYDAMSVGAGGAAWGAITGTLSSQTDLNTALGLKSTLASPTFTGTVTLPTVTNTGAFTNSANGASSAPQFNITGSCFVGTGTTSTPCFYINQGSAPTTWSTSTGGTLIGLNAVTSFGGNFIDAHLNGGAQLFGISSTGSVTSAGTLQAGASSSIKFAGRSVLQSASDGVMLLTNSGATGFTRLQLGLTTTSGPAFCVSGTTVNLCLGDGTTGGTLQVQGSQVHFGPAIYLTSAYTNATTTASNLTDGTHNMAFTVAASTNYAIECDLVYQSSNTTAGLELKVTGPASPTALNINYFNWTTATANHDDSQVAFAGTLGTAGSFTATTNLSGRLFINLANGVNAGTVQIQALAAGSGTVTVQPGGVCRQYVN